MNRLSLKVPDPTISQERGAQLKFLPSQVTKSVIWKFYNKVCSLVLNRFCMLVGFLFLPLWGGGGSLDFNSSIER
jgi:hypothetical protein